MQVVGLDLAEKFRGQGLSKAVYLRMLGCLKKSHLPIVLWVLDFNHRARSLYLKLGFKEIERTPFIQAGSNRECTKIMMQYQA